MRVAIALNVDTDLSLSSMSVTVTNHVTAIIASETVTSNSVDARDGVDFVTV